MISLLCFPLKIIKNSQNKNKKPNNLDTRTAILWWWCNFKPDGHEEWQYQFSPHIGYQITSNVPMFYTIFMVLNNQQKKQKL